MTTKEMLEAAVISRRLTGDPTIEVSDFEGSKIEISIGGDSSVDIVAVSVYGYSDTIVLTTERRTGDQRRFNSKRRTGTDNRRVDKQDTQ